MNVTNFYTVDEAKEEPTKEEKQLYERTGIKMDTMNLIVGGTGSGKTNVLLNFFELSSGLFSHIYVLHKIDEKLYKLLVNFVGEDNITFYKEDKDFPTCEEFEDQPGFIIDRKGKKKKVPIQYEVIIFDDVVNNFGKTWEKKIRDFFIFGRKKHLTCFYLSQSYYDVYGILRKQAHNLLLLYLNGKRDLERVLRENAILDVPNELVKEMYHDAIKPNSKDDMPFFKITCGKCDINIKYSRNFTDFYNVSEILDEMN